MVIATEFYKKIKSSILPNLKDIHNDRKEKDVGI